MRKAKEEFNSIKEKLGSITDQEVRIIIATGIYLGEGFDDERVDRKEYTWDELGEMMMTFEGWDFKLKIFESWEEE